MLVLFGSETPMPTPSMTVDPDSVTPGFAGFAAIVIVLVAVVLLIWDMNRRIRKVRYRDEVREELDAEEAAARDAAAREADGPDDAVGDVKH
ncbi:hypothetical protein OED01_04740 [Microbacterium sp. M28]|uniref:hypothetical protein n=1 Tax=Microbacterium sp. M28 TaxID=2962064 RepID=UPI0021F41B4B|nr:hypothetical protein [Microbacterium sp. M28]UYO98023.1 hypothetical protein OED01_04740 [Microbacterium sp. M28]